MVDSPARRFQGRRVVLAFLAILALVVATTIAFFFRASTPDGKIVGLRAEGERSALVLREARGKKTHVQLLRSLEDGTQPHKISLFGVQPGAAPFVVGDRVIVEAMTARGYPTIQAFEVRDLSFSYWGPEPAKTLEDGARGATLATSVGGTPVLVSVHRGSPGELLVVDARDGKERVRRSLEGVASPARLTLLRDEGVRVGLEDGGSIDLDLRDGSEREEGHPVVEAKRCPPEPGSDAAVPFEGGCLVRRGGRFETRGEVARSFEIGGKKLGPTRPEHVQGTSLFLVVDETEIAIVDLSGPRFRGPSHGLSLRTIPDAD